MMQLEFEIMVLGEVVDDLHDMKWADWDALPPCRRAHYHRLIERLDELETLFKLR